MLDFRAPRLYQAAYRVYGWHMTKLIFYNRYGGFAVLVVLAIASS